MLRRKSPQRLTFGSIDRIVFAGLYRLAPGVLDALEDRQAAERDLPISTIKLARSATENGGSAADGRENS